MAGEFEAAGARVLFLEQNVYQPVGVRLDRFHDARGTRSCGVPWVIVDSGASFTCGYEDFTSRYQTLVSERLGVPPLAEVEGWFVRSESDLQVQVRMTNRSGQTLGFAHWPMIHVLVYEDARVSQTSRFVRAADQTEIDGALADGASTQVAFRLEDVPVRNWSRAHVVALVDHRPEPSESRFVAMQAAELPEGEPPTPTPRPTYVPGSPRLYLPLALP